MRKQSDMMDCQACGKEFYCKPSWRDTRKYCSFECFKSTLNLLQEKPCEHCGEVFKQKESKQKYCGLSCSATATRRPWSTKKKNAPRNINEARFRLLKKTFEFESCMIEGCEYHNLYEVHRFHPGREGGEYVVGNMFAICPNHHAEITRKFITVEKINDSCLRIIE
jgi:hypothetical protein